MDVTLKEIKSIITLTVLETAKQIGAGTTELSFTKAYAQYGDIFRTLVKRKKITPRRVGSGKSGKHYYAISDILAAIAEEEAKAKLV